MKPPARPKYRVSFGRSHCDYYTDYHAVQFCRALALNGTPYTLTDLT